ncbi:MAG TPA: hypothetical protein VEW42_05980 [Candidatus Eisenbacteria bacterium]|nr:hypothetical protein [Candidatus Eisenbacteria bacterium]
MPRDQVRRTPGVRRFITEGVRRKRAEGKTPKVIADELTQEGSIVPPVSVGEVHNRIYKPERFKE